MENNFPYLFRYDRRVSRILDTDFFNPSDDWVIGMTRWDPKKIIILLDL